MFLIGCKTNFMKAFVIILVVLLSSLFISCSGDGISISSAPEVARAMSSDYAMSSPAYAPSPEMERYSKGSLEPRIQINGNLSLEVQNLQHHQVPVN